MILMCLPQILKGLVHNQSKMILLFKILILFNQKKEDEQENVISVEIAEPRRSGRERKQTALYGSPLLYTITCKLTPKFVPVFFNKMSETLESLQTNYLMDSKCDDSS